MAAVLESGDVSLYEEEESFFQDIDLLQNHGINVADIKKLKTAGILLVITYIFFFYSILVEPVQGLSKSEFNIICLEI